MIALNARSKARLLWHPRSV